MTTRFPLTALVTTRPVVIERLSWSRPASWAAEGRPLLDFPMSRITSINVEHCSFEAARGATCSYRKRRLLVRTLTRMGQHRRICCGQSKGRGPSGPGSHIAILSGRIARLRKRGGQLQDVSDEVLGAARIWRSTSSPLSGDTTSRPGPMLERAFRAELESSDFVRSCPVIVQVLAISAELVFGGFRPNLARFHDQFRPEFSQKSAISVELGPTLANFGFGVGDVRHEDLAGEFGPLWAMSAEFGPSRAKFQKRKLSSANSSLTRAQCMRACVWVCAGERVSARTRASERVRKGGSECVTESGYVATCGTYIDG